MINIVKTHNKNHLSVRWFYFLQNFKLYAEGKFCFMVKVYKKCMNCLKFY